MTAKPLDSFAIVSFISSDEVFGHEKGMIESLLALQDSGARIIIGFRAGATKLQEYAESRGLVTAPIDFGPQISWRWVAKDPAFAWRSVRRVLACSRQGDQLAREFRATHVHIGSIQAFAYLYIWLRYTTLPIIYRAGDEPPRRSSFQMLLWRAAMRRASAVVCNSEFVRQSCLANANRAFDLIYNYVAEKHSLDLESRASAKRIIYLGAMSAHKGLDVLLRSFAMIRSRHPDACLDLVGGSKHTTAYEQQLRQRALQLGVRDSVRFHGYAQDCHQLVAQACLMVTPSLWNEPAANVVLEAKRAGIPSIVFPSGGLVELVDDGVDGLVCATKSPECLADSLDWALSNMDTLRDMGIAAHKNYTSRFGLSRFRDQWAEIYKRFTPTSSRQCHTVKP